MKFTVISVVIAIIFSILLDTITNKEKKDIRLVLCKLRDDKKYLVISIINIVIVGFMASIMEFTSHNIILLSVIFVFFKIVIIDIESQVINMKLFIILMIISIVSLFTENVETLSNLILTGICLFVLFWIVAKVTNEAIGKGDAMLLGALGLVFGLQGMCGILLLASLLTCLVSIFFLIKSFRKNKGKTLAFTPYIYISILVLMFINNF